MLLILIISIIVAITGTAHGYGAQVMSPRLPAYQSPQVQPVQSYGSQMGGSYQAYPRPSVLPVQPSYGGGMTGVQVPGFGSNGQGAMQRPMYGMPPSGYQTPGYNGLPTAAPAPGMQYPMLLPQQPMCPFDEECFKASPECTISNAYPFERRTPVNCSQCLDLCLEKQFGEYPYICKSVVYDAQSKTCDIFAVDGLTSPQNYLKYPGRSIYRPTGACQVATKPTASEAPAPGEAPVAEEVCKSGSVPKIVEITGYGRQLKGSTLADHNKEECALACMTNQDKNGVPLELEGQGCHVAIHSSKSGCQVTSELIHIADMSPDADLTTYKVICVPEKLVQECPGNFFYSPHHVLVGFAKQVVTAEDDADCILKCLESYDTSGFSCTSGMFYFSENNENCILNTEDRKTQSQVYTEDDEEVIYFELGCSKRRLRKAKTRRLLDAPDDDDWTEWSTCTSAEQEQVRFKRCDKKDVRQCQSQRRKCKMPSGIKQEMLKKDKA